MATRRQVPAISLQLNSSPANRDAQWKYQTFAGPGDTDESYDAADFQNMFLALQTVTPRAQGRVVTTAGETTSMTLRPSAIHPATSSVSTSKTCPSLRSTGPTSRTIGSIGSLNLTVAHGSISRRTRVQSDPSAVRRRTAFRTWACRRNRPARSPPSSARSACGRSVEDHPHFDGSNPQSRPSTANTQRR